MPSLVRHPDTPPGAIHSIEGELERAPGGARATFMAFGDISRLVLPSPAAPVRSEGLWRTTCFELFVADSGTGYREFNFSPSSAWAAYRFDDYRQGMRLAEAQVKLDISHSHNSLTVISEIKSEFPVGGLVGLTAVIEEEDRVIRYWSTGFAPGDPDFHAPAVRSLLFDGVSAE